MIPLLNPYSLRFVCLATPVEDPERFARAQQHFTERGVFPDYFHGLHKSTSGLDTSHLYMVDRPEPNAEPYRMGPHPTNIWLGHYFLWQALKLSGQSHWAVIECDAQFHEGWQLRLQAALFHTPPDFDFLYFGSCCTTGRGAELVEGDVYQMSGIAPQCNHGYIIAAKAVPVLERVLRKVWAPIDIQQASETFARGYPLPRCIPAEEPARRLHTYVILPRIVDQFDTELMK